MAARLFTPLGMSATTARQPPEDGASRRSRPGYSWDGAQYHALPFRYTQTGPAGAVSTTAADMSRFMLAVLGDGSLDGVRVLSPASRAALLRPQFRDHPSLPGVTYGFHEWRTHGRVLLHHDGTLDDQVGVIAARSGQRVRAVRGVEQQSRDRQSAARAGSHAPLRPRAGSPGTRGRSAAPATPAEVAGVYVDLRLGRGTTCRGSAPSCRCCSRASPPPATPSGGRAGNGPKWRRIVFQAPGSARTARLPAGRRRDAGDADVEHHLRAHRVDPAGRRCIWPSWPRACWCS